MGSARELGVGGSCNELRLWRVYMARCADGSLYTGITTNIERRIDEHNSSDTLAAKYTRMRRPVVLVYQEPCRDRAEAARREYAIKRLRREEKLSLIAAQNAWLV